MEVTSFNEIIENAIIKYWNLDAVTDYKSVTLQYHEKSIYTSKDNIKIRNKPVF